MSWFQNLDQMPGAAPATVGYNAYYLGQLRQHHLPAAEGWVLTTEAWREVLKRVSWPDPDQTDSLATLDSGNGEHMRHTSRAWQKALHEAWGASSLADEVEACPLPDWTVKSSLWVEPPPTGESQRLASLHGLLPEQVGRGVGEPLLQSLWGFWRQALTVRSLMVWQQYCPSLNHLGLGTLVTPLYPAQSAGRLTMTGRQAKVEAVAGLGLPLTRGEAIPARCQIDLDDPDQAEWQPGYQEQIYELCGDIDHGAQPNGRAAAIRAPHPLQVTDRPAPALQPPLNPEQLGHLLQLATEVEAALPGQGVQMEWILCPSDDHPDRVRWVITQAMPWVANAVGAGLAAIPPAATAAGATATPASPATAEAKPAKPSSDRQRQQPEPPPLPQVSVVVKGIGASAGRVRGSAIVAQHPQDLPQPLPPGRIVVLPDLQPDRFLQLGAVAGIVTEQGGATCHAAILAREMGIPAVVGAPQATQLLDPDLVLWLDGERGLVYGLAAEVDTEMGGPIDPEQLLAATSNGAGKAEAAALPAARWPSLKTKVMVNLSQSRRVKTLPLSHIDGVGLLRSEWLMLEILDQRHPWHWVDQGQGEELQTRLAQSLEPILQALGDKPVRYRSLDLRSHEWQALEGSPPVDANPMLGLRGTLSYGIDSRLFEIELGALATLQQRGFHNLQLMLPFVRSVEEVLVCRQYIDSAGLRQNEGFALWIMAEVPSVLFLLPAYARAGVQGIAIGSNDLTQLLLAVDRDQRVMASAYDERHPVVRMALAHLIQEARRSGMTCSICGQAPVRHPGLIEELVAWGIDSISVEAAALPFTLEAIWQAEQRQA